MCLVWFSVRKTDRTKAVGKRARTMETQPNLADVLGKTELSFLPLYVTIYNKGYCMEQSVLECLYINWSK